MLFTFIFFKFLIIFFSILLISSRSVMVSLLNLIGIVIILVFFCFILNFDFLAMVYLIVYIGAVTVLFLFVLMMLNFKKGDSDKLLLNIYFLSLFLIFAFCWLFLFYFGKTYNNFFIIYNDFFYNYINFIQLLNLTENIKVIGSILYLYRFFDIVIISQILLISMVGSIILILDFSVKNVNETYF